MQTKTSRVAPRAAVRMRVDYTHEGNYLVSHSRNISADGMFVCTDEPLPVGTSLQLVFSLGHLHELTVGAQVVWTGHPGGAAERGMGLQFLDPPPALAEAVLEVVRRVAVLDDEDEPTGGRLPRCTN